MEETRQMEACTNNVGFFSPFYSSIKVLLPMHATQFTEHLPLFRSRKEKLLRFFNSSGRRNGSEYKALHPTPSSGYLVFLLHFCPKSLFQHILLVSICFSQIRNSYLDVLAQ